MLLESSGKTASPDTSLLTRYMPRDASLSRRQCPTDTLHCCTIAVVREFPPDVSTPVSLSPGLSTRLWRSRTRIMSCSILAFGIGFVVKCTGFTLVSTFFVANRPDLGASCIQRFRMSTCFASPSAIDQAHRCRGIHVQIQSADIPRSLASLWIPSPSEAVLTAAKRSPSADDSATTCCFLVHTLRQRLLLMMTPAETDRRVALSPPQSASE